MEKENNSKPNKAKSTSASNSTNSKAKNAKAKNERTDSKISDNAIKDTNKATKSNLKASQTENDVKPAEKRDDLTLASQEEKIKKNAGKDSKRKKAAVATAVVLLLIAGVTVPTAVYLARRKVTVDVETNVEIIEEYTINVKRGVTIKDIVPQEIKGYTFVGFYKDAALTNPYKDTDKINKDTTIYAKYEANIYKVTLPTSPSFTIEGEGIVDNQVEVEYNSEYSFKLELNPGYEESDIIVKVNGEALTPDQEGYYTITINGDMTIEVEGVEINTYEVTFYDSLEKNEIYQNQEIQYNQLCIYTGVTPTKTNTHTYKYTFIGWVNAQGEVVDLTTTRIVSDLELFANFKEEYIEYSIHKPEQVNIQNAEGIYLSNTATLHYGDIVTITYDTTQGYDVTAFEVKGAEKISGSENQYRITGNLEVIYTEEIQTFTVSIAVNNADYGTVNTSSITVDYGTEISVNGNQLTIGDTTITATPTTDNPTYDYAFTGWTNTASEVTEAITIIANFEMTMDEYEVTIAVNEASYGTINLSTVTVNYDTPITVEDNKLTINGQEIIATPTASDAQYTYAFGNWTIDNEEVTTASKIQTDLTITANFTRTVNTYTVTWLNWDGSTLETDIEVKYGTTPTYDSATPTRTDAIYAYTFTGWSPTVSTVTGDVTYTAQFDQVAELLPYEINDFGEITKYTGTDTEVVIPSTYSLLEDGTVIAGTDYTITGIADGSASNGAFYNNKNITSVTLPNTIEKIGSYAFFGCTGLTSITIPENVTSIGGNAFRDCTGLTEINYNATNLADLPGNNYVFYHAGKEGTGINIGTNVTRIPAHLFTYSNITSVNFAENSQVTSIGNLAFYYCIGLTSITIPENVTSIGRFAFSLCTGLTEINYNATNLVDSSTFSDIGQDGTEIVVNIGANVTRIPTYTFSDSNITSVNFAENSQVTSIGDSAFSECTRLTSITLPERLTSIESNVFNGCTGLTSITIPDSVTRIGFSAFNGCTGLTSITIPDSVTSIAVYAFYGCTGLTSITIPDSVTSIGWSAFKNCTGLTSITLPEGLTSIENYTFDGCTGLTSIKIPKSVTIIGSGTFQNCSSLTSITIPASVTRIESFVFSGCTGLTEVTFENIYGWSLYETKGGSSTELIPIDIELSSTDLQDTSTAATYLTDTYKNYYWLREDVEVLNFEINDSGEITKYTGTDTEVIIPSTYSLLEDGTVIAGTDYTITGIADGTASNGAFYNNKNITSVTLPNTLEMIGNFAFSGCTGLTSITIPESVTSIGDSAFSECTGLTSITIPDGVTSIGERAFHSCTSLTSITIPENVTGIGVSAFNNCTGLTEINFNATNMPDLASGNFVFYIAGQDSTGITVNIGENVTRIPAYLFNVSSSSRYSPKITTVNFVGNNKCTEIGSYAFHFCTSLISITIPASVTSIGDYAFGECASLTEINFNATNMSDLEIGNFVFDNVGEDGTGITVNIGENVQRIPAYLFSPYSNSSYHSPKITTVNFVGNSQCTEIGSYAFNFCTSLTSITIPASVTSIVERAFENCTNLTSVTFGENSQLTSIGYSAFYHCYSLVYVVNKSALEFNVGDYGTSTSDNPILEIVSDESEVAIVDIAGNRYKDYNEERYFIKNLDGSSEIEIDPSCTRINNAAFYERDDITSVTIPESVTSIGSSAFSGCTGLTSITIPESVTSIGYNAFSGCNLTSVTIESNYAYKNAGTGNNQCGYLLQNATEVRVHTRCIGTDTNNYLENTSNFTKTTSEDGLYYIYTKV